AGERVRRDVRAHPPQRAGGREIPRAHRAQCRWPVLRAAARLRGAAAGEPAHGRGAEGALQDLTANPPTHPALAAIWVHTPGLTQWLALAAAAGVTAASSNASRPRPRPRARRRE